MRKHLLAAALTAGLAVQALATAGPSSAATIVPNSSGGGCSSNVAVGDVWTFAACISARSNVILPDGYARTVGTESNCTIWVDLIHNGSVSSHRANPCDLVNGSEIFGVNTTGSGTFFTGVYVEINGAYSAEVISPNEYQ